MIRILRVRGHSLSPEFEDGDFVLSLKFPIFFPIRAGDTIVFRKPPYGLLIKQVERVDRQARRYWVKGTHPHSLDSRTIGVVSAPEILGKVILKISKS